MSEIESGERWIRSYEDSWQYKCGQLCVRFMFTKVKVAVDLRQRAHLEWLSETRCLSASSTVDSSTYMVLCAQFHSWLFHMWQWYCVNTVFQIPWLRRLHYNAMLNCCRQFVLDSTFSPTFIILPFTSHKLANIIGSSWAPYTEYVSIVSIVTVVTTRKHCDCVSTASIDSSQKTSFQFFFQARRLSPFFSWPRSIWEGFPVKSGWNHLLRGEQSFLSDMKCQAMK